MSESLEPLVCSQSSLYAVFKLTYFAQHVDILSTFRFVELCAAVGAAALAFAPAGHRQGPRPVFQSPCGACAAEGIMYVMSVMSVYIGLLSVEAVPILAISIHHSMMIKPSFKIREILRYLLLKKDKRSEKSEIHTIQ